MRLVNEHGQEVDCLVMGGYRVGERLLEGANFWITLIDGKIVVKFDPADVEQLKRDGVKIRHWEKEALSLVVRMLRNGDEYEDKNGNAAWIEQEEDGSTPAVSGGVVPLGQVQTFGDLFS